MEVLPKKLSLVISNISSHNLVYSALILWFISLTLPVFGEFSSPDENNHLGQGFYILLMGWMALFQLNFAWLANIFFLAGLGLRPKSYAYSGLAVVFSLDTLRFTEYLANEGGSTRAITTYGWGAVIWGLAMCLLLWANEKYDYEEKQKIVEKTGQKLKQSYIGAFLFFLLLSLSVFWAISDRVNASDNELYNLKHYAFKKGDICRLQPEEFIERIPLDRQHGPLEIVVVDKTKDYTRGSIANPKRLVSAGIPWVRYQGDFHLEKDSNTIVIAEAEATPPFATIFVKDIREDDEDYVEVKLVETSANKVIFEQRWNFKTYFKACPDYYFHSWRNRLDVPSRMLFEALNLPITEPGSRAVIAPQEAKEIEVKVSKYELNSEHRIIATMRGRNKQNGIEFNDSFKINNRTYIGRSDLRNLLVQDGRLYKYSINKSSGKKKAAVYIREIYPDSFSTRWYASVPVEVPDVLIDRTGISKLVVKSIHEKNGKLSVTVIDVIEMEKIDIQASIEMDKAVRAISPDIKVNLNSSDISVQTIEDLIKNKRTSYKKKEQETNKRKCNDAAWLKKKQAELQLKKQQGKNLKDWEENKLKRVVKPDPESKFCKKYLKS